MPESGRGAASVPVAAKEVVQMLRSRRIHYLSGAPLAITSALMLLILALPGCGSTSTSTSTSTGPEQPAIAKDANGTTIVIPAQAPQRIISLTAGDSTMLGALGAASHVVAVDVTTDYPADMAAIKPKLDVYSTSAANLTEQVVALRPDLVLSWGGFTSKFDSTLEQQGINVVDLPAEDLTGTLQEIRLVGQLLHEESQANSLVQSLQQRIASVKNKVASAIAPATYMEVSYNPTYAYGGGSFGDEIIRDAGGTNIFANNSSSGGYPQVSNESIIAANPQVIILTDGPGTSGDPSSVAKRSGWSGITAVKDRRVYAINPDLLAQPGPRLVDGLEQVAKALHPELFGS
jgi:iron complex transport system substrate-binding protein